MRKWIVVKLAKRKDVETWQRAIPRSDLPVKIGSVVCSDHFSEADIRRVSDDIVVWGTVIEKGRELRQPILREGAVPIKFTGPSYLSKKEVKRRAPKERIAPPLKQRKLDKEVLDHLPGNLSEVPECAEVLAPETVPLHGIDPGTVKLPRTGWGFHLYENKQFYIKVNMKGISTHIIELDENGKMTLKIRNTPILLEFTTATKSSDVEDVIKKSEDYYECEGNGFGGRAATCKGGILRGIRCKHCRDSRKSERKKMKRKAERKKSNRKRSKDLSKKKNQNTRLRGKIKTLKQTLREACRQCAKLKKGQVEKAIEDLPEVQKQLIRTILQAAKKKSSRGNRYTLDWIYEAMLMRIRSPKLYNHIRKRKIMPLPSRTTLGRYMKKITQSMAFNQFCSKS
ncbi:Transposable element P transposase [Frankliniella fusca]|uniref:Transposable element P transposase n=1 Tax=Frankliniella fusca TaxID=407009 RepID=A0AAE1H8C3_9NEOP|nr:Transposable element P transposase [Frankliniella fusca]